jgi:hypothetical protein
VFKKLRDWFNRNKLTVDVMFIDGDIHSYTFPSRYFVDRFIKLLNSMGNTYISGWRIRK